MKPYYVLVIEDDVTLREVLVEKLKKSGYKAHGAVDGVEGLEFMRETPPDLVLLDILMPRKDGMQVLEEKKSDAAIKDIPVIIISNSGQPVEIDRARELGAKDFLIKAIFEPSEVLEKVEKVLASEGKVLSLENNTEKTATTGNKSKSNTSILVVEDDQFLRELISQKLLGEGFQVESVIDAKNAYEVLKKNIPDIMLLDIILPGESGFSVLEKVKKDPRTAAIPVIVLSNLGQREDVTKAMALGAEEFLVKANFTPDEIVTAIKKVLK